MSTGSGITIKELQSAANGNFNAAIDARNASTMSPKATTNTNAQQQAFARASGNPGLTGERNAVTDYNPQALNTTPMLSQAQANLGIGQTYSPNMGLSSEGKYSGFYTASDRHNAVLGQAMQSKDRLSSQLRDLATSRYAQTDSAYFPAAKQNMDQYSISGTVKARPNMGGSADAMERYSVNQPAADAYGQRDTALKNWYAKNIAPANEANESANANDLTPLSTYATAIASRNYNINPYAAAGEFNNADSEMYRGTRDQASVRDYGMPYDELNDLNAQYKQEATDTNSATLDAEFASDQAKTAKTANSADLENLTGMNISALKQQTGSSEENLHNILFSDKKIRVKLNEDSTKIIDNIPTLFNEVKKNMMIDGNYDIAVSYVKNIEADNPELASILRSYIASYSKTASKTFDNLYDPFQFQQ